MEERSSIERVDIVWIVALTLIGAWYRLRFLDAPIRYDEAFTFLTYVRGGTEKLFDYSYPNNHIFHTVLVRGATDLFGRQVPIIRLPAFVCGVLTIPLSFQLARRLDARATGYLSAVGVATWPFLVLYGTIARGYSLLVALTLSITWVGLTFAQQLGWRRCAGLALLSALGMWTMPSMAFALAGLGLWIAVLLLLSPHNKRRAAAMFGAYVALTCAFTLALYAPTLIISGKDAILNNRFVVPLPWPEFAAKLGPHLQSTLSDFARDVPPAAAGACGVLMLIGLTGAFAARNWAALTLLLALLVGAAGLLMLQHSIPFARTWIFLLPFVLLLADVGLGVLLQRVAAARPVVAAVLLACGTFACWQISAHDLLARYPDVGAYPEAPALVQRLKPILHRNEPVRVRSPGNFPVRFYLWYYGVPEKHMKPRRHPEELIVVRKGADPMPDGDAKRLFDQGSLEVYSRPQRNPR